jgi:hypothetical protein
MKVEFVPTPGGWEWRCGEPGQETITSSGRLFDSLEAAVRDARSRLVERRAAEPGIDAESI